MIKSIKQEECELLLQQNYIGHLAYVYQNRPFVIPITYFYNDAKIICYSNDGHKIKALRTNSAVALEVSEIASVNKWQSVVAHGTYEELDGITAKAMLHEFSLGVKEVILKKELKDLDFIREFSVKIENGLIPVVFVIHVEEMTGKIRRE
ncbi:pyridoxamine 5'-phosphate oxidase family protein [Cellulophaga sp. Hel_I_12]|uniref:pyridoxamine 5'-phosphate oxidase family protein n=1 Tax=Cellulophaga sp. Hel_I_12 TaxID=1249972 RepID=UPI000648198E|nr:pyridoxamine 5'-phosphate oxidase family protein [Cellulophaga sp. Hel_I_12]